MKTRKLLLTVVVAVRLLASADGYGQTSFSFQNLAGAGMVNAPVFDALGNPLAGTHYLALLYGGAAADNLHSATYTSGNSYQPVLFTYMPGGRAGYFQGLAAIIDNGDCGGFAWLQVRAWDARLGATYEQVVNAGLGGYGESIVFQARGGCYGGGVPGAPGLLIGLQSFSLLPVVPEPSAVWLLLLGAPLLFLRRRRT